MISPGPPGGAGPGGSPAAGGIAMAIVMGTAGHIDHGKTSLVRKLTGIDCDRLEEEKRRGITIELGFAFCAAVFSGNLVQSLSASRWVWCIAAFGSYLAAAVMNANLTAILRENVPAEMQGRVFSAKDTLSNCTIPLGLFLGGVLADYIFEPLMATEGTVQSALATVFGTGGGAGIAVMFFLVGAAGMALSLSQLNQTVYRSLKK